MPVGGQKPRVEDTGALLVSVAARLTRLYGKVLAQQENALTFRQQRLLMRVREGHSSMATLAAFGNLTVPTVSESIDGLVRKGLMTRTENPENRRSMLLGLTPLGEEACDAADAALDEVNRILLAEISNEQLSTLHEALDTIFEAATECFRADETAKKARVAR
jgi:MarR family transcriptional regulator, organic hydroperoxide resistance regulator